MVVVVQVKPLTIQVCCGGEMVSASTRMPSCSCAAFREDSLADFRAASTWARSFVRPVPSNSFARRRKAVPFPRNCFSNQTTARIRFSGLVFWNRGSTHTPSPGRDSIFSCAWQLSAQARNAKTPRRFIAQGNQIRNHNSRAQDGFSRMRPRGAGTRMFEISSAHSTV